MTYSIIGFDPEAERLGIAVASGSIAVGSRVPWARYLVGGVVTQAYTNPSLGPIILGLMEAGAGAKEALEKALGTDPDREMRQVAVLKWGGRDVAYYTGSQAPPEYSGYSGNYCVAVANLVSSTEIPKAMCRAFERSLGMGVAEALLEALQEASSMGGDKRGDLSAALLIVGKTPYTPYYDKILDIRVDYSRNPVAELARVYRMTRV